MQFEEGCFVQSTLISVGEQSDLPQPYTCNTQQLTEHHKHSVDLFFSVEIQCVGTWEPEINVNCMYSGKGKDGILNLQNDNK